MDHLVTQNIIDPFQSGFRAGYSPETCLVKLVEEIKQAQAKKMITALILFDYTKAFDRVNYDTLLNKLKRYGFDDHSRQWLKSYLVGRKQRVLAGNLKSEWGTAENGVPQGSVLGPLLFLIYMNDISSSLISCRRLLFADDLQIYFTFPISELQATIKLLQTEVESLSEWCIANSLTLNSKKTQAIFLGHKVYTDRAYEEVPVISTKIGEIAVVKEVKNLGILMDSALNWEPQTTQTISRVKAVLYRLRKMSALTDIELRSKLVATLIFPLFDYCAAVYGDLSGRLDSKLQVTMNSCIRYVFGLNLRDHVTPSRIKLQWLSARNRRLYLSTRLLHKIIISSSPNYLTHLIKYQEPIYPTRIAGPQLKIEYTTSQQFSDSFSIHTSKFWNSLPPSLRTADTVNSFKSQLKSYLLQSEVQQSQIILTP